MGKIPLEDSMATHSTILAWIILWTEKPGSYSPWGHKESDTTESPLKSPLKGQPVSAEAVPPAEAIFLVKTRSSACLKAVHGALEMACRLQKARERKLDSEG